MKAPQLPAFNTTINGIPCFIPPCPPQFRSFTIDELEVFTVALRSRITTITSSMVICPKCSPAYKEKARELAIAERISNLAFVANFNKRQWPMRREIYAEQFTKLVESVIASYTHTK